MGSQTSDVAPFRDGVRVVAEGPGGRRRRSEGTHLLVAAGRRPNTDGLDLAAAGVEADEPGVILADDYLETNVSGVWAIGDVNGAQPFTRVCQEEAKIAYASASHRTRLRIGRTALGGRSSPIRRSGAWAIWSRWRASASMSPLPPCALTRWPER